ncbi:MAG TPA: ABC transporter substrate-binding protein [Desulfobacteraceae bacterium]|nr:ABC transporter substrate-binding protein [Desulfobacteraceae bacterium]
MAGLLVFISLGGCDSKNDAFVHMAVEFVDHAACAHIARNQGWYEDEGLKISSFENYITGVSLATALGRGDINAAYICLIPAICARANSKLPIKIVAGTHRYGYGLLVNPDKVTSIRDLERPDVRIGCSREGSPVDALMHKTIDKFRLDEDKILSKVHRMPPPKVLLALKMGRLDAGFCCEQFPTMGEEYGFEELLMAQDVWPEMQGSVLIVTEELIQDHPDIVRKLAKVTQRGTRYIREHPEDAAAITAGELTVVGKEVLPLKIGGVAAELEITPEAILKSLTTKMECATEIDPAIVQDTIDYLAQLGYIKNSFNVGEILDLRFCE